MKFYDNDRKNQFGACYAASARGTLFGVIAHLSFMQKAQKHYEWSAAYKAGVVTCRSALHVLHKKDGARSPFLRDKIAETYALWKSSTAAGSTFHLLEQERNFLLKEGRSMFPVEESDDYQSEPRLLVATRFIKGSEVVRDFAEWAIGQISDIEEGAFWSRRQERQEAK